MFFVAFWWYKGFSTIEGMARGRYEALCEYLVPFSKEVWDREKMKLRGACARFIWRGSMGNREL